MKINVDYKFYFQLLCECLPSSTSSSSSTGSVAGNGRALLCLLKRARAGMGWSRVSCELVWWLVWLASRNGLVLVWKVLVYS